MNLTDFIAGNFIIFCRVGGCMMVAPGFSSERVPIQARLYLSVAISLIIAPMIMEPGIPRFTAGGGLQLLPLIAHELVIGFALGLLGRLFILALETLITTFCLTIGLGNIFNSGILDAEATPALSTLIVLAALQLIFVSDLHHEIIRGIDHSYQTAPIINDFKISGFLDEIINVLTQSHLLALRITSPFLIFALIVNLAFAFLARLSPQTPIFFISGPCVILLGLYAFDVISGDFMGSFIGSVAYWMSRG